MKRARSLGAWVCHSVSFVCVLLAEWWADLGDFLKHQG